MRPSSAAGATVALLSLATLGFPAQAAPMPQPVIDVHRHAPRLGADDDSARREMLESMTRSNVRTTLLFINEPADIEDWAIASPNRFIAGVAMPCWRNRDESYYCFPETGGWPSLDWLERELAAGRVRALGEMLFNYAGVHPDDRRMRPYWALAAKYDVPVLVHSGRGPGPGQGPREDEGCCVAYDGSLGNPELLRPVLDRHPNLRIALLHFGAGEPPEHAYFHDEALALLRDYPSVYVDLTIVNSLAPPKVYAAELRRLIDAGFGDRIMFGTDNLPAELILDRLAAIDWLSDGQRRAILFENAARFLRVGTGPAAQPPDGE